MKHIVPLWGIVFFLIRLHQGDVEASESVQIESATSFLKIASTQPFGYIVARSTLLLNCSISTEGAVRWMKYGKDNDLCTTDNESRRSQTCVIKNVTRNDTGNYTCIGTLTNGTEVKHTVHIEVTVPTIRNVFVEVGELVRLRCHPDSNFANILWYKNDIPLNSSESGVRVLRRLVRLRKVELDDTGIYQCKMVSGSTVSWRNISITVHNPAEALQRDQPSEPRDIYLVDHTLEKETRALDSNVDDGEDDDNQVEVNIEQRDKRETLSAPSFTKPDQMHNNIAKPAGSMLRLRCLSDGNPTPNITWYKNKELPTRMLGMREQRAWALSIEDLVPEDSGKYTCVVCNTQGCIEHTFEVDVIERFPHKPYINPGYPKNVTVQVNGTAKFECTIVSDLEPYIEWLRTAECPGEDVEKPEGKLIQAGDPSVMNPDELKLYNVSYEDEGWYTCIAGNTLGTTFSSAYLRVVENFISIPDITSEGVSAHSEGEGKGVDVKLLIGFIVAVLLILIGSITWMRIRDRSEMAARRRFFEATLEVFRSGAMKSLDPKLTIADQAELLPYDKKWEFPRKLLKLDKVLGSGAFGIVKKGYAEAITRKQNITTVAVKMVRATQSLDHMMALQRELKILANLGKHLNIVNLLGACTNRLSYGELFVIVEFCRFGNLHDYLLRRRADFVNELSVDTRDIASSSSTRISFSVTDRGLNTTDSDPDYVTEECGRSKAFKETSGEVDNFPSDADTDDIELGLVSKYRVDFTDQIFKPIGPWDLMSWAWQVSKGMKYIGSKKVLHGDLAARNILLTDNKVVKICDFGLAKSLYANDIYKKEGQGPLPIKWMAIESIKDRLFSIKSDVWSYGVVLWEFYSLAETPYPGIPNENVYQKLIDGFRMEQPKYAIDVMYNMMLRCWDADPSERPSFEEIENIIHDLLDDGVKKHYLDLDAEYAEINADSVSNQGPDVLTMSPTEYTSFMSRPRVDPSLDSSEGTAGAE